MASYSSWNWTTSEDVTNNDCPWSMRSEEVLRKDTTEQTGNHCFKTPINYRCQSTTTSCSTAATSSTLDSPRLAKENASWEEFEQLIIRQFYMSGDYYSISTIIQDILSKYNVDTSRMPVSSIGAVMHDNGLCKPCVFANKNNKVCRSGSNCIFCHEKHSEKRRRNKKVISTHPDPQKIPQLKTICHSNQPSYDKCLERIRTRNQSSFDSRTDSHRKGLPPPGFDESRLGISPPPCVEFDLEFLCQRPEKDLCQGCFRFRSLFNFLDSPTSEGECRQPFESYS